ncbi:HET-domain-containing protein [Daldinia sp. FL1419]|nr:HET-domain-containing protein [Daldinia sp. FL1419]
MWCLSHCLPISKRWEKWSTNRNENLRRTEQFSYSSVPLRVQRYGFSSLNPSDRKSNSTTASTIRLLRILPRTANGLLACRIRSVDLGTTTAKYDAISYTWGHTIEDGTISSNKDEKNESIICNDKWLFVGKNLFDCLVQLERNGLHYDRDLWVDAICIDQNDNDERSQQVSIMADIYGSAECVIVWLGVADKFTQKAWELIERLSRLTDDGMLGINLQEFGSAHDNNLLGCSISREHWRALASLFGRRWFTRAWVVQELILARRTTILCGDYIFNWKEMVRVSHFLSKRTSANTFRQHLFDGIDYRTLSYKNPTKLDAIQKDIHTRSGNILLHTLVRCRSYDATEKHDKVYSILGLPNCRISDGLEFYPDYNESAVKLYTNVAKYIIKTSEDLHILAHAEGNNFRQTEGLPTWVPDWSVKEDLGLRITGYTRYNAAGTLSCFENIQDGDKLVLHGFELDTITRIGKTKKEVNNTRDCRDWLDLRDELQREYPARGVKDAFWRTLLIDTDPSTRVPIRQPWENSFYVWMGIYDEKPSEFERHMATQYETSFTHSLNLRLFRTAQGHLGCGTSSCSKGDSIWIVQGSRVPLILRPVPQVATYELVGGTYIHGFMQGEALGGQKFRNFTLV